MTKLVVKSIPGAAKVLLDFIAQPESRGQYGAWSAFKQGNLPKKLTDMTLAEVLDCQRRWRDYGGISSAAGRYQIIRKTLEGLVAKLGLSLDMKFDARLQDYLGYQLLRGRGYDRWYAGELDDVAFGKQLAMEWASLPVLAPTKNYKGANIKAGTSYYAGDGLNSHGVSVNEVIYALNMARTEASVDATVEVPEPTLKEVPKKKTVALGAAAATAGGGIALSLPPLDVLTGMFIQFRPFVEMIWNDYGTNGLIALGVGVVGYFGIKYIRSRLGK